MNKIAELNNLVLYQNETGNKIIEVLYDSEDFWLTQKTMADLFSVKVNTINYHLKEIFNRGELEENSTIRKIRIVQNMARLLNVTRLIVVQEAKPLCTCKWPRTMVILILPMLIS